MEKPLGVLLDSLPLEERAARCRQFAQEALRQAHLVRDPKLRANYLTMAAGWHGLAAEPERLLESHIVVSGGTEAQNTPKRPPKH